MYFAHINKAFGTDRERKQQFHICRQNYCRSRESEESSVPPDSEAESATSPEAPPKAKRPRAKAAHALEVAKQGRICINLQGSANFAIPRL